MTDLFKKIKNQYKSGFPFAVYAKPGSTAITGVFQNSAEPFFLNDYAQQGFAFAPFNGDKICFIPAQASDVISVIINETGVLPADSIQPETDTIAKRSFEDLVAKSVSEIKQGHFEKLVLSRKETFDIDAINIVDIYHKLLFSYPMAYRYCFYHPESGLWLGATPEQLLKVENRTLHTVALAGTQLYKEGEKAVWENKEKEEQLFVTNYIIDSLKQFTIAINSTEPYTFRAGNIVHIKTDISADLKNTESLAGIIDALHPTPAVCGLPKQKAKEYLIANEGYERDYYSGFLGELNIDFATGQSKTDLFVNLRCMKIDDSAHLYIGCGITKDSDPEKEFLETVNKSMTMRRVL
ncbi:isochorismate synthase [Flavobacterium sp. NRK1]|uniref:isochorismate synthase n=1 Tax=Flavobacterium sp. NRK1 TaxID=2954929 RepID=UPI0020934AF1|nr:isochorismate synthase [Flavobacterium sp. NRK1]MCO6146550.1 isochorismate synthase [Flavobacterium sp. NRK1]